MALEITDASFEETVLKSDKPVMVDFWATLAILYIHWSPRNFHIPSCQ